MKNTMLVLDKGKITMNMSEFLVCCSSLQKPWQHKLKKIQTKLKTNPYLNAFRCENLGFIKQPARHAFYLNSAFDNVASNVFLTTHRTHFMTRMMLLAQQQQNTSNF